MITKRANELGGSNFVCITINACIGKSLCPFRFFQVIRSNIALKDFDFFCGRFVERKLPRKFSRSRKIEWSIYNNGGWGGLISGVLCKKRGGDIKAAANHNQEFIL